MSPIHGTNGNVEYLLYLTRGEAVSAAEREQLIADALAARPDDEQG